MHTQEYGITYNSDQDFNLYCYVDGSYNLYDDGKSHNGYDISSGKVHGSFCTNSSKIPLVMTSSAEAEYVACCYAAQEIV